MEIENENSMKIKCSPGRCSQSLALARTIKKIDILGEIHR